LKSAASPIVHQAIATTPKKTASSGCSVRVDDCWLQMQVHRQSREYGAAQVLELGEALVERDQFQSGGTSESGEEGITPNIRRKRRTLCVSSPMQFHLVGFTQKMNSRVAQNRVVEFPGSARLSETASSWKTFGFVANLKNPC
jgi:hypothetical protein